MTAEARNITRSCAVSFLLKTKNRVATLGEHILMPRLQGFKMRSVAGRLIERVNLGSPFQLGTHSRPDLHQVTVCGCAQSQQTTLRRMNRSLWSLSLPRSQDGEVSNSLCAQSVDRPKLKVNATHDTSTTTTRRATAR